MPYRVHYHHDKGLRGRGRTRMAKRLKRIMMIALILIVILVAIGLIYTWYMGLRGNKSASQAIEQPTTRKEHTPPPTDPNAPVGVYIQSLTTPATPGSNAALSIRTQPDADCVVKVTYGRVESKDSGLSPKRSDEYGMVRWSWTIEPTTPVGKAAVDVTCSRNKRSGYMHGDLAIVKELP